MYGREAEVELFTEASLGDDIPEEAAPVVDLEAARAKAWAALERAGEATPGPWRDGGSWHGSAGSIVAPAEDEDEDDAVDGPGVLIATGDPDVDDGEWISDRTFIAAARADVPELGALVVELAAEIERLTWDLIRQHHRAGCHEAARDEAGRIAGVATAERDDARAGEASRKAEIDRSWQVLRDEGDVDEREGSIDRRMRLIVVERNRAEVERDTAQEALKAAATRHEKRVDELAEEAVLQRDRCRFRAEERDHLQAKYNAVRVAAGCVTGKPTLETIAELVNDAERRRVMSARLIQERDEARAEAERVSAARATLERDVHEACDLVAVDPALAGERALKMACLLRLTREEVERLKPVVEEAADAQSDGDPLPILLDVAVCYYLRGEPDPRAPVLAYLHACDAQQLPEALAVLVVAWRSKATERACVTCLACESEAPACTCIGGPRTVER